MSEFDSLAGHTDSAADNNFDNDFEKLDPFASTPDSAEDLVTSTMKDVEEAEDLFSASAQSLPAEANASPLVDLGLVDLGISEPVQPAVPEPSPPADSTGTEAEEKPKEPSPIPVIIPPKKTTTLSGVQK